MNYAALIENRKSVRSFQNQPVEQEKLEEILAYYKDCQRLDPAVCTELKIINREDQGNLETAAGYEQILAGAPCYLVLLTEVCEHGVLNGAYMMEDLVLKLQQMGLSACWLSFSDGDLLKKTLSIDSSMEIAAMIAFGYGALLEKKMRFNMETMSCADIIARRGYYAPKKDIRDFVFVEELDQIQGLDERIGFYDDMLWQAFYACSKAPSYLNRQPYAFILKDGDVILLKMPDPYTDEHSFQQNLGIVMLHFSAIAQKWQKEIRWDFVSKPELHLPAGCQVTAVYHMEK